MSGKTCKKTCGKCGFECNIDTAHTHFNRSKAKPDGFNWACRKCHKNRVVSDYERDRKILIDRAWRCTPNGRAYTEMLRVKRAIKRKEIGMQSEVHMFAKQFPARVQIFYTDDMPKGYLLMQHNKYGLEYFWVNESGEDGKRFTYAQQAVDDALSNAKTNERNKYARKNNNE